MVDTGLGAELQDQPPGLDVHNCGQTVQQRLRARVAVRAPRKDKLPAPYRRPQNNDSGLFRGKVPTPDLLAKLCDARRRLRIARAPHAQLAEVGSDACASFDALRGPVEELPRSVAPDDQVHVVQECEAQFFGEKHGLNLFQRMVKAQSEKLRHERIPLLSALSLGYLVGRPPRGLEEISRGSTVEEQEERDDSPRVLELIKPTEHRRASDMIVGSDTIEAEQNHVRVCFQLHARGVDCRFGTHARADRELLRRGGRFNFCLVHLGKRTGDDAAGLVTSHDPPHPNSIPCFVKLVEGREAAECDRGAYGRWNLRVRQPLRDRVERVDTLLRRVFQ